MSTYALSPFQPNVPWNLPQTIHTIEMIGNKMVIKFGNVPIIEKEMSLKSDLISAKQLNKIFDFFKFSKKSRVHVMQNLSKKRKSKFSVTEISLFIATLPILGASPAYAADFDVDKAFDPLIRVIKDLANPICYIMFIIGFIYVMIGRANEGFKRMQYASFGYIGMQFAPGLMSIIKQVGAHISTTTT